MTPAVTSVESTLNVDVPAPRMAADTIPGAMLDNLPGAEAMLPAGEATAVTPVDLLTSFMKVYDSELQDRRAALQGYAWLSQESSRQADEPNATIVRTLSLMGMQRVEIHYGDIPSARTKDEEIKSLMQAITKNRRLTRDMTSVMQACPDVMNFRR